MLSGAIAVELVVAAVGDAVKFLTARTRLSRFFE